MARMYVYPSEGRYDYRSHLDFSDGAYFLTPRGEDRRPPRVEVRTGAHDYGGGRVVSTQAGVFLDGKFFAAYECLTTDEVRRLAVHLAALAGWNEAYDMRGEEGRVTGEEAAAILRELGFDAVGVHTQTGG